MRKYLFFLALALTAGCTTIETYHTACTEGYDTIAAQVACVRANVAQNPSMQSDTQTQEYLKTGDYLAQQVAEGKMSEKEAQMHFVAKLNQTRQEALREQAYQATIDRANRDMLPRQTECHQKGDKTYCTTY